MYRRISSDHNQSFDAPGEVALAVNDLHAFLHSDKSPSTRITAT
ncbi:MAG: hypothetical protein JWM76_2899 [Pseudonocardiales bacterium]|nr:hypothetical protein [Pseudonocardiales bacterium]